MKKILFVLMLIGLAFALTGCVGLLDDIFGDIFGGGDDFDDGGGFVSPDFYEPDDDRFSATSLFFNSPQTHTIHNDNDSDYYSFFATAAYTYFIDITPIFNGVGIRDVDVRITDSSGFNVSSQSGGFGVQGNSTETASFVPTFSGTYFVEVYSSGTGVGDYQINLSEFF